MTDGIRVQFEMRRLDERFRAIPDNAVSDVAKALKVGSDQIRSEAVRQISRGTRAGRIYKRKGKTHQASAPGEYPKTDTGQLVSHIFSRLASQTTAEAGTDVAHGIYLERGTQNMAPRVWLHRSFDTVKVQVIDRIAKALNEAIRRS